VNGNVVTVSEIPATIAAGADTAIFAGFYQAGAEFGHLTVSWTLP
jgi:hypothetical protein